MLAVLYWPDMGRSVQQSSLKGHERAIVNQSNTGTVLKALGKTSERRGRAHMGFSELFFAMSMTLTYIFLNPQGILSLYVPVLCLVWYHASNICTGLGSVLVVVSFSVIPIAFSFFPQGIQSLYEPIPGQYQIGTGLGSVLVVVSFSVIPIFFVFSTGRPESV